MISGKELFDWLYKITVDKLLHFISGLLIAQISFALLSIGLGLWWSALLSVVITAIIGGIKEFLDVKYGVPSVKDFVATLIGGLVGVIMILITQI